MRHSNVVREIVHVSELKQGDTVEVSGNFLTVSQSQLTKCNFLGFRYKGDPHRNGITRIKFIVPTSKGFRYE